MNVSPRVGAHNSGQPPVPKDVRDLENFPSFLSVKQKLRKEAAHGGSFLEITITTISKQSLNPPGKSDDIWTV